jgi:hypothetical protein
MCSLLVSGGTSAVDAGVSGRWVSKIGNTVTMMGRYAKRCAYLRLFIDPDDIRRDEDSGE